MYSYEVTFLTTKVRFPFLETGKLTFHQHINKQENHTDTLLIITERKYTYLAAQTLATTLGKQQADICCKLHQVHY